jgi:aquaporin TIP
MSLTKKPAAELIVTFFLVLVVYGSAIDPRAPRMGGLFIGLTVTLDILAGGAVTGASMNPAPTFGPALVGGYRDNHLVYWVGPLLGGGLAGLLYKNLLGKQEG